MLFIKNVFYSFSAGTRFFDLGLWEHFSNAGYCYCRMDGADEGYPEDGPKPFMGMHEADRYVEEQMDEHSHPNSDQRQFLKSERVTF